MKDFVRIILTLWLVIVGGVLLIFSAFAFCYWIVDLAMRAIK